MEIRNKKNHRIKSIGISFAIAIFTLIVNIPIFIFITNDLVKNIEFYLNHYFQLYPIKPVIFPPLGKIFSICLIVNICLLLIIEFAIICLFHKQLNKFFKIENLFTIKKFIVLGIIIVAMQMIISYWLWCK